MTPSGRRKPRSCVVCGTPTLDRTPPYNTPRCTTGEFHWIECAMRRNQDRARPKPPSAVVAEARSHGHPVPPALLIYERIAEARSADVA